jgi:glycosyltransferase involved in cell wall biosynthesis
MKLSVLMPVYNESRTIREIVRRVLAAPVPLDLELIAVDDASRDGSGAVLDALAAADPRVRVVHHEANRGKTGAVRSALERATGDLFVIQDSDLEYNPRDYPVLLAPLIEGTADAVFGSRFLGAPHRVLFFWHWLGNRAITLLADVLYDVILTDIETCYKAFTREVADRLDLRERGFGLEPEMTAKMCRMGCRIFEVPVSYNGRTYAEGKKITWRDGLTAIRVLLTWRFRGVPPLRRRGPAEAAGAVAPRAANGDGPVHG